MLVRIPEWRNGVKVEHGHHFDAGAAGDELFVLRDAAIVFCVIPREENDDRVQGGARQSADPMLGRM